MKKRILIIHTGGTFGMVPVSPSSVLAPEKIASHVLQYVPELPQIAEVEFKFIFNLDSAEIHIPHWIQLGETIKTHLDEFDGFVIIHGTDTMVYSAAALSYMLRNLPKPVVFTGSQRPLAMIRTDARMNLINAVELATYPIPEVSICFDNKLLRGNRTIKYSSVDYDAFRSPNYPPLATVGIDIHLERPSHSPQAPFEFLPHFSNELMAIRFFPGLSTHFLQGVLETPPRVVFLEALGLGNVAIQDGEFVQWVEKMVEQGTVVLVGSQSPHGYIDLTRYQNGVALQQAGAIGCGDMTNEAAIVKAMHLLGLGKQTIPSFQEAFLQPIAGEITA